MPAATDRLAGMTLIEALTALLVVSVGMVGIAALYGRALAASADAIYSSHAGDLAAGMAERIRANRSAVLAYTGAASEESCACLLEPCSAAEMAAHDLFAWRQLIERSLPGGAGWVEVDAATMPVTYNVNVSWREAGQSMPVTFTYGLRLSRF